MVKTKLNLSDFAAHISGMRGYYNEHKDDDEWKESAENVKRSMDGILKFAYINHHDIENNDFSQVYITVKEEELSDFYSCDDWDMYDTDPIDFETFFRDKDKKYHEWKDAERERWSKHIKAQYQEYLDSDKCNSQGRKSKADFARHYGYNVSTITSLLRNA